MRHDIYRRFTITNIKIILRQYSINFCAFNIVTSSRTTLYMGIKNKALLLEYEEQLKHTIITNILNVHLDHHQ